MSKPVRQPVVGALGIAALLLAIGLWVSGCSLSGDEPNEAATPRGASTTPQGIASQIDAVLYTIGLSTDPYGSSQPGGFGVLLNPGAAGQEKVELRNPDLGFFGGADWVGDGRILVPRNAPPFRQPLVFRLAASQLLLDGHSPLPALDTQQEWSPDGELIASKPIEPCEPGQQPRWKCYRQVEEIYLQSADGSKRRAITTGRLDSWTPDGRILVGVGNTFARFEALSPSTQARTLPLQPADVAKAASVLGRASLGPPRWSADHRFIAALVAGEWPENTKAVAGLVIARADGTPVRVITSPYLISMFAWAPTGHRLAWTTSGFPDPHELFVLDTPNATPRRLFMTPARHFDWITWSPDGRRLLLDDESAGHWRLLSVDDGRERLLPRLGGRPLWCCPLNAYATFNS